MNKRLVTGKDVVFKKGWYNGKSFTIRSINDKKIVMGDPYRVAEITRTDSYGITWRSEVLQEELEMAQQEEITDKEQ